MPFSIIKVRFEVLALFLLFNFFKQSNLYNYNSISESITHIYKTSGIRGFFMGFGATALRDAPNAGIYVAVYQEFKKLMGNTHKMIITVMNFPL